MKPIKYKDMDVRYLMALLQRNNGNYEEIVEVLAERLDTLKIRILLEKCNKEKNPLLKELLEVAVARKFLNYILVGDYEIFPTSIKQYLENVSSLDALCLLMQSRNRDIVVMARKKYEELFDAYLETFENENSEEAEILYTTEGDDTEIIFTTTANSDKIIPFIKIKVKTEKEG